MEYKKIDLEKGKILVYDFKDIKVHNYNTEDAIANQVILLEKNKKLVVIESPTFYDNNKELEEYIKNLNVEDDNWHKLHKNYEDFINKYKNKKILLLELGVGFNTPGIIRFPFEEMTAEFKNTNLIRVNEKYLESFYEIENKMILIKDDCKNFITKLQNK